MRQRRSHGEGSVFQRASDGLYIARTPGPNGKVKTFSGKTEGEAIQKRTDWLEARARGEVVQPVKHASTQTVKEYLTAWMAEHPMSENTRKSYQGHMDNHIFPAPSKLAKIQLSALTPTDIRVFIKMLQDKPTSPAMVVKIRASLSSALNDAVEQDPPLIGFNPCVSAKAPAAPSGKRLHKPFREDDVPLFLKVAQEHWLWPVFATLLGTGARSGEVTALDWPNVSLKAGNVDITKGKTKTSVRTVPLPDWALDALIAHHKASGSPTQGPVFRGLRGGRLRGDYINKEFHKVLTLAGIDQRRVHDLRHSFATLQIAAGTDIHVVKECLGHDSIMITSDFYASANNRAKKAAAARFDGWVTKPS